MKPFFSVIIPTLNEELFLPRVLKSLKKQKEKNFEVIVTDGNSQDKTKKIAQKLSKVLNLRLVTREPNLPLQKNLGAKQSEGEYLLFLDADMSVSPAFTRIAKKHVLSKKGFLFLPYVLPIEKDQYPEVSMLFPVLNSLVELSQKFNKPFSSGPAMIWEKHAFNTIGGFDNIFGEDHQIVRKAHAWGIQPKFLPQVKVLFSLRRMKKEGRLLLFYKFIISHIYLLFNTEMNKKLFSYEMGGHHYKQSKKSVLTPQNFNTRVKSFFRMVLLEK